MLSKLCAKCSTDKPVTEFYRHFDKRRGGAPGLQHHCKECQNRHHAEWSKKNRDKVNEWARQSQRKHRTKRAAYSKAYYQRNRQAALRAASARTQRLRMAAYDAYGGRICGCCGEADVRFLSLDHINNDGGSHRRELFGKNVGAGSLYMWLKRNNYPPGYQVLCMNCNYGKRMNGGVCPHADAVAVSA